MVEPRLTGLVSMVEPQLTASYLGNVWGNRCGATAVGQRVRGVAAAVAG